MELVLFISLLRTRVNLMANPSIDKHTKYKIWFPKHSKILTRLYNSQCLIMLYLIRFWCNHATKDVFLSASYSWIFHQNIPLENGSKQYNGGCDRETCIDEWITNTSRNQAASLQVTSVSTYQIIWCCVARGIGIFGRVLAICEPAPLTS